MNIVPRYKFMFRAVIDGELVDVYLINRHLFTLCNTRINTAETIPIWTEIENPKEVLDPVFFNKYIVEVLKLD